MEKLILTNEFDLREILEGEFIAAHFQPIVSVRKKMIVGYEGLSRGINPENRNSIPPVDLFGMAEESGRVLELDRLCRKKVLEYFRGIRADRPDRLLFLNFNTSVIDQGVVGSGNLIHQVQTAGLQPQAVALEIIESNVRDLEDLQKFIQTYRNYGFLIALDDVGAGHSNLNRIPMLKPDILKIDRYLIQDIQVHFHKQEVFKSLVGLAHKIGALILAEGVETQEEALAVIELGADMIQGYYFSKPTRYDQVDDLGVSEKIEKMSLGYKESFLQKLSVKRFNLKKYELLTREVQAELSKIGAGEFDRKLQEMIHYFPLVECLYVLDEKGIQVTETVFGEMENKVKNPWMFRPALKGSDHTMKDYFYMVMEGGVRKTTYTTEPYISLASGNLCVTFARLFKGVDEKIHLLCVDINTEYLQKMRFS